MCRTQLSESAVQSDDLELWLFRVPKDVRYMVCPSGVPAVSPGALWLIDFNVPCGQFDVKKLTTKKLKVKDSSKIGTGRSRDLVCSLGAPVWCLKVPWITLSCSFEGNSTRNRRSECRRGARTGLRAAGRGCRGGADLACARATAARVRGTPLW